MTYKLKWGTNYNDYALGHSVDPVVDAIHWRAAENEEVTLLYDNCSNKSREDVNRLSFHRQYKYKISDFTKGIGIDAWFVRASAAMAPRSDASDFPVISVQCNQRAAGIALEMKSAMMNVLQIKIFNWSMPDRCRFLRPWNLRKSSAKWRIQNKTMPRCT